MEVKDLAGLVKENVFYDEPWALTDYRTLSGPASLVYRLEFSLATARKALFVKLPNDPGRRYQVLAQRLRHEYEVTRRVHAAFPATDELGVVVPVCFLEEVNGLVTWEVIGPSLQDVINRQLRFPLPGSTTALGKHCDFAGQWLQRFQDLAIPEEPENLGESLSDYFSGRLDRLVWTSGSGVTSALAGAVSKKLKKLQEEALTGLGTRASLCHNDYSPHNIIVTGGGVCVLDFSFSGPGFPVFDAMCFWHKLEDLKTSPFVLRRNIEYLQSRFIQGCGRFFDMTGSEARLGLARLVLSKMVTLLNEQSFRPDNWIDGRRRYARYLSLLKSGFEVKGTR